ncbi:UDP-N-acetylmuramyl peptide synthase [Deltaproteobacteria bacterium Smac51]|nr:UDP-N-acetylmuramyl peptide synthase [Deltaproteobacteria bacterium Smac51]
MAFFASHALASLYDYHMFQLNSYKPEVQMNWLRRNFFSGYLWRHAIALIILPAAAVGPRAALVTGVIAFSIQGWLNRPRKAKKPLVYTPRVKRMLIANAILTAIFIVVSATFSIRGEAVCLLIIFMHGPILVLASNYINAPIEKSINKWYINDARRILAENPALTVIGVTGSYGKTSTKHYLQKILSGKYNVLMTPESYNTTLGVVRTIRENFRPVHNVFICEMGAKGLGQIKEICDIVHPRYGVITSIGPQHLESFKTQENIITTKFELAESLPDDGAAFLNYDNNFIREYPLAKPKVTYGVENGAADYTARNVQVSSQGSVFTARLSDGVERTFETRLIGRHNVENIIGAIAVADKLGVRAEDIALGVRRLESVPHRLQLINRGGTIIIDDAYNSNEQGAAAALDALAMFDGFKILATPGMIELGAAEDECNFRFGVKAAEVCDYVILAGEKQTRSILAGLKSGGFPEEKIFIAENLARLFGRVESLDSGGRPKVVLLENDLPDNYS